MKKTRIKLIILSTLMSASVLSHLGCSSTQHRVQGATDTTNLNSLRQMAQEGPKTLGNTLGGLRFTAIRDTALSLGARGGLAWRAAQINAYLDRHTRYLDRIFNFNALMLPDSVLAPVLIEGRDTLEQRSEDTLRVADRSFIIQSQARFVTAPPTWRDYLKLHYDKPTPPDRSLLPRISQERAIWDHFIQQGWQAGIQQAEAIYSENLGRLKRDFEGMIRYRVLLAQGIVTAPYVAKVDLGVTGHESAMTVNDRILRITAMPAFQVDPKQWRTEIIPLSS